MITNFLLLFSLPGNHTEEKKRSFPVSQFLSQWQNAGAKGKGRLDLCIRYLRVRVFTWPSEATMSLPIDHTDT